MTTDDPFKTKTTLGTVIDTMNEILKFEIVPGSKEINFSTIIAKVTLS